MILPRANNGMQFVCSIVHLFNGIFHVSYSNVFKIFKACFLKERLMPFEILMPLYYSIVSSNIFRVYIGIQAPCHEPKKHYIYAL